MVEREREHLHEGRERGRGEWEWGERRLYLKCKYREYPIKRGAKRLGLNREQVKASEHVNKEL